jgi:hypothetical protein
MVKCTTSLPSKVLSDNDSKLYINFEFCDGKAINNWETRWSIKSSNFCWPKNNLRKVYVYFLKDGASSVQVGILNTQLFEHCSGCDILHKIDGFLQILKMLLSGL